MLNSKHLMTKLFISLALLNTSSAFADESSDLAAIKQNLTSRAQPIKPTSVATTPLPGIYEVLINGEIFYVNKEVTYFIAGGNLIQDGTKRNITKERLKELTSIEFSSLPTENAIKIVKGTGAYQFAVFSDPDCPFCKQLEKGLEKLELTDYTAYIYLLPLKELHPDAAQKAENIWCAKDKKAAWLDWMIKGTETTKATCTNPIAKNEALANKIAVTGTPTIYLEDGSRTQDPKALVAAIKQKQSNK